MKYSSDAVLLTVDLAGVLFFGSEGATAAIQGRLDLFGVLVLSFATALGGGVIRDLLIGAIPPAAVRDARYPVAAFLGGGVTFAAYHLVTQIPPALAMGIDAAGLSLFAVAGTAKALDYEIHPFLAVLMGTITGVGGGTIRDIFLATIPGVLRTDIYATAALFGSAVLVIGLWRGLPRTPMMILGGCACFVLRLVAVWQHWNLPAAAR